MNVQSSNCFYKISMFKRNGVNAYVGAYLITAQIVLFYIAKTLGFDFFAE